MLLRENIRRLWGFNRGDLNISASAVPNIMQTLASLYHFDSILKATLKIFVVFGLQDGLTETLTITDSRIKLNDIYKKNR